MKKIQKQQQYKFEEFDQHVSLWNIVPSGKGNSLVLLRKIIDGIQSGYFDRSPTILITGEGARTLTLAFVNTLCAEDIREWDAKYLIGNRNQMDFFSDSLFSTIHIIPNADKLGLNEGVVWNFLRNRKCKFSSFDGKNFKYIHTNGIIVLISKEIKLVSAPIISAVDFKVVIEPYTQQQLELIVHQRLHFCGIDYGEDEKVLKTVVEFGCGLLEIIIDLVKTCILLVQTEQHEILTPKLVVRASKLV